jgi:ring-1,2-phenylacetyl-CoA epoxidase subunit PaaE
MSSPRHAVFHPLTVSSIAPLTEDSVCIEFDVPAALADDYDFDHGQHLTIRTELAGDDVRRSYSICAPAKSGRLRIGVKVLPGGHFSGFATTRLAVGDVLDVMTPAGTFSTPLDPANAKHYCAIAAGSGITPVMSIIATTLEQEPQSRFTLLFANRTSRTVMFLEELEDLKDRYRDRFHLVHIFSREPQEAALLSGRLDAERLVRLNEALVPVDSVDEWFLCGPYAMIVELRDSLLDRGVDRHHVHTELFHVDEVKPVVTDVPVEGGAEVPAGADGSAEVTITLDGRQSTFTIDDPDTTIMTATLVERPDAPYSCRNGVCGTCRALLVEGEVTMDQNYALDDDEVEEGYVLTCQSHPTTPKVVVDFDD